MSMAKDLWGEEVSWWRLPGYWRAQKVNLGIEPVVETREGKTTVRSAIDAQAAAGEAKMREFLGRVLFEALDEIFERARLVEKQDYESLCEMLAITTRKGNRSDLANTARSERTVAGLFAYAEAVNAGRNQEEALSDAAEAMGLESTRQAARRLGLYRKNVAFSPETDQKDPSNPPKLRHG